MRATLRKLGLLAAIAVAGAAACAAGVSPARADAGCDRVFRKLRPSPPKNQCNSQECYLFAFLTSLEIRNANRFGLRDAPTFSAPYLIARKLEDWAEQAVTSGPYATYFEPQRGQAHHATTLVLRHGLLSEDAYRPPVAFAEWNLPTLVPQLERRAAAMHDEVAALRNARGDEDPTVIETARARIDELRAPVRALAGAATPEAAATTARAYGPAPGTGLHLAFPRGRWAFPSRFPRQLRQYGEWQGAATGILEAELPELETGFVRLIDAGDAPFLALETSAGRHAVVGTGYARDGGALAGVRIQNSGGPGADGHGSYWLDAAKFRRQLLGITVLEAPRAP